MEKEDRNGCDGCPTSEIHTHSNHCLLTNVDSTCPCGTCLVKAMCYTMCDTLINYRSQRNTKANI